MRRSFRAIPLVSLVLLAACGPAFESGPGGGVGGQATNGSTASTGGGSGPSSSVAGSGGSGGGETSSGSTGPGGAGGCDQAADESFPAQADTYLESDDDCASELDHGGDVLLSMGTQNSIQRVTLLRFEVSAGAAAAIESGDVLHMSVKATIAKDCGDDCVATGGSLQVRRLRNDWLESLGSLFAAQEGLGANWCRRGGAQPWNKPGAEGFPDDTGNLAGSTSVQLADPLFEVALDPKELASWVGTYATRRYVSLRLNAGGTNRIVVASRENDLLDPPVLRVKYCTPPS